MIGAGYVGKPYAAVSRLGTVPSDLRRWALPVRSRPRANRWGSWPERVRRT